MPDEEEEEEERRVNRHAPWKLPVLVPLWLIQFILALVYLVAVPFIAHVSEWSPGMDYEAWFVVAFSILTILIVAAEIVLFYRHALPARVYLVSQWVKATLAGTVWVVTNALQFAQWRSKYVFEFAFTSFLLQHPALIASLYYASLVYTKYGGDAGASRRASDEGEEEEEEEQGDEEVPVDETSPLLREAAGNA
ncbi:MAG: hypothetical protein M1837_005215 [Sclerophora amabilis]|nr:MAG: hypothetical protein M1837_005215 [Sclerophora amabilis]